MNEEATERIITKISREFGNEFLTILNDPLTIEIMLNPDGNLWVEKFGQEIYCHGMFEDTKAKSIISSVATLLETVVNTENPILECELPLDGSRFEALLPPVVASPTFTIRKKASRVFTLDDYVNAGTITPKQNEIIIEAIQSRKNILVVGGTGTGKTTLSNAVLDGIAKISPDHRLVIIEDTAELQCNSQNKVFLRSNRRVGMLELLKATMRLRPDRIIVGETRGKEALDLLKAWNTGHPGGIATVHANSAKGGLTRLEQLISEVSTTNMADLIAEAVNLIIFIKKTSNGRKVEEIAEVKGFDKSNAEYLINQVI
jgi:type IV secretion system protein VirB11